MNENRLPLTVYLEDTDAQGIVYHANYLKYCERARTELLRANGLTLGAMQRDGMRLVVFEMNLKFHRPAQLHDELEVHSRAERTSDYRVTFHQEVFRKDADTPIFVARATVVAIDEAGQLCPAPEGLFAN